MKGISTPKASTLRDARYQKSDQRIRHVLNEALAQRRINLRPIEICRQATITYPTFHAHYASSDEALKEHESNIRQKFEDRLPAPTASQTVIFTVLLGFVREERGYFGATLPAADHWLLTAFFMALRPCLTNQGINNYTYDVYIQTQIGIIACWARYENFALQRIPYYVNALRTTRMTNYGW